MRVGVVDIGTNSMRLLITDGVVDVGRWAVVTGLGRGVDASGILSNEAVASTIAVLGRFGGLMDDAGVANRLAMATSATRDASNRDAFLDAAEEQLGVRPVVISGEREGRLAYAGATTGLAPGRFVVSDIGGGSTEFVRPEAVDSIDIGSVRLTDRLLPDRPSTPKEIATARSHVRELFSGIGPFSGQLVGVAGTWTSLAGIDLDLHDYDDADVHHHVMGAAALDVVVDRLALLTVEATAAIPSLDPARAPVILAGSLVAAEVVRAVGSDDVLVSSRDTLDGLARELLDLA